MTKIEFKKVIFVNFQTLSTIINRPSSINSWLIERWSYQQLVLQSRSQVTVKRRDMKTPSHTQDTREDTVLNQSGNTYLGQTTDVVSIVSPTTDLFPIPTVPTAGPSNPFLDFDFFTLCVLLTVVTLQEEYFHIQISTGRRTPHSVVVELEMNSRVW